MTGAVDLAKMVPGFEFLQGLMKNASAGVPGMGQWVAPTLDPDELDKRISELRTVQYWLEQNARLLGTTIQALEVQRMTLSTLQTMNLPMADLRESLKAVVPKPAPAQPAPAQPADRPGPRSAAAPETTASPAQAAPPAVDPMQWWSALTQQFTDIAAKAMKDTSADAARNLAGAVVKQSIDSAGKTLKKAVSAPAKAAARAASGSPRPARRRAG